MFKAIGFRRLIAAMTGGCAIVALAGCNSRPHPPAPTFSPNGEPLVGPQWPAKCEDALGLWFDRVDVNHDGRLTLQELETDAARQYRLMDLRHDGKVSAEELSTYRLSVMGGQYISLSTPGRSNMPERRDQDEEDGPSDADSDGDAYQGEGRLPDDDSRGKIDAFAALVTDQPDPVMSADTDLDGSVTWDEFRALVAQDFADLDQDHAGSITKPEVQSLCEKYRE